MSITQTFNVLKILMAMGIAAWLLAIIFNAIEKIKRAR